MKSFPSRKAARIRTTKRPARFLDEVLDRQLVALTNQPVPGFG